MPYTPNGNEGEVQDFLDKAKPGLINGTDFVFASIHKDSSGLPYFPAEVFIRLDFLSSAGGLFNCIAFNSPIFSEILANKLSISLVM
ncbi:hypothetical protein Phep_1492 [Pedobacter heparinus DSM 2366]|uniref:Uncharacterized protein n=1 Tax=Pedobacter heparinus (strain ATCC 13125 / DSM 2366 / CIP 104194 / JCM 7457 / NBRC 12017 / NCIMB 9290 / NRRL B-14731 / HIM 762-3) TaxID=485917 RepID=C6XTS0_PEDHD|nr:hypothetical protein Phep_1492 [Pedobacter heparinus DSM 2366]